MSSSCDTDTWIHHFTGYYHCIYLYRRSLELDAQLLHVLTPLLYRLTDLHALIIYVFLLHRSWFILLLHGYFCISVTWLFPVIDIDIPVIPLLDMWIVDIWYVELSATWIKATGATSRIPHLPFLVSRYLVLCYQQSSCPVIMLHVPCTVLVLATLYILNIIKITWGWGDLTVD